MIEWILVVIIALLQLVDGYTTREILKHGGRELNPIQKRLMDWLGVIPSLVVSKFALVACSVWAASLAGQEPALKVLLYFVALMFTYVCAHNIQVWKNYKM
jgi:hypothetical protein